MFDNYYINLLKQKYTYKPRFDVDINIVNCDIFIGNGKNYVSYNEIRDDTLNLVYHYHHSKKYNHEFDELQNYLIIEYNIKNNKTYNNEKFMVIFSGCVDHDYIIGPDMDIYDNGGHKIFNINFIFYEFDPKSVRDYINNKKRESIYDNNTTNEFYELIKNKINNKIKSQKDTSPNYININIYTIFRLMDFLITEFVVDNKRNDYKLDIIKVMSKMTPRVIRVVTLS